MGPPADSDAALLISTQYDHCNSTDFYLKTTVSFCSEAILQCANSNKFNIIYLRLRGDTNLIVPLLLQAILGISKDKSCKMYTSRHSNCLLLRCKQLKLKIGFDGKLGTHSVLHAHTSLPHLHIGMSSSLMYESMKCMNNVVYLPTSPKDFMPQDFFIKQKPFVAHSLDDAMRHILH